MIRNFFAGQDLGSFSYQITPFSKCADAIARLKSTVSEKKSWREKSGAVSEALYTLLKEERSGFLLPAALDFIEKTNHEKIAEKFTLSTFELWLNTQEGIGEEENKRIRSLLVGKQIPRDDYQRYFPVGMGKRYPGPHYVSAHASPDLDTTVASFWGWVDAFGARVSEGVHLWNVPGGPAKGQVEIPFLFHSVFGESVFDTLAKTRAAPGIHGMEIMSPAITCAFGESSCITLDHMGGMRAVAYVDAEGRFLDEWRETDVESVRTVIILFNNVLRWYESYIQRALIRSLAGNQKIDAETIMSRKVSSIPPVQELPASARGYVDRYLKQVIGVENGIEADFSQIALAVKTFGVPQLAEALDGVGSLENLSQLQVISERLSDAIIAVRTNTERLDLAMRVKRDVFGNAPKRISARASIDEIKGLLGTESFITLVHEDQTPIGAVRARDLYRAPLGTVTLRDYSNPGESRVPSYLDVISVIDHHKTHFETSTPPVALISDSQSVNALLAEVAFQINDRYSSGGIPKEDLPKLIQEAKSSRILQRLHMRSSAMESVHTIDPMREFLEYLHFLYAIFDDTDLLTKVSSRDVDCVCELINRLKSLSLGKEVEVVSLENLPRDHTFAKEGAKRLLQNAEMYSLYQKVYAAKEAGIKRALKRAAKGESLAFFADTKEQNGCARVGQTKLFAGSFPSYEKHLNEIRTVWLAEAKAVAKDRSEYDLHMQMISTLAGAEELYRGEETNYTHKDELWIWAAPTEMGLSHLRHFLRNFSSFPLLKQIDLELELFGDNRAELSQIFVESFLKVNLVETPQGNAVSLPIAVLRYKAGSINSRKAQISPFLPKG